MAETSGEKTEKPTAKRLADAVKNGDILQSKELSTALVGTVQILVRNLASRTRLSASATQCSVMYPTTLKSLRCWPLFC